jgi:hypothetical protein
MKFSTRRLKIPVSLFPRIFQAHSFTTDYLILPINSVVKQHCKEAMLQKYDFEVRNLQQ